MPIKPRCPACLMPVWMLACLLMQSACSASRPVVPVPSLPPMPIELNPTPVTDCAPITYREALACALRWRTGWREAEADKAAARELWLTTPITPQE